MYWTVALWVAVAVAYAALVAAAYVALVVAAADPAYAAAWQTYVDDLLALLEQSPAWAAAKTYVERVGSME